MGWLWLSVPVALLVLAALWDRRARRHHRLRSGANMVRDVGEAGASYVESPEHHGNPVTGQRTPWSVTSWFGGGSA
jgi:hypothetical protein